METVPGSLVNGGGGDQEVGSDFDCEEGEGDIARWEEVYHRVGVGTVTALAGPGMSFGWGPDPTGGRELPQRTSCPRDIIIRGMVKTWGGC